MNKGELIESVASQMGETRAMAARAVDAVLESIAAGVKDHDRVTISGFGSFEKKRRAARTGMNPATKEKIQIAPSTTVGFKPAASLKSSM